MEHTHQSVVSEEEAERISAAEKALFAAMDGVPAFSGFPKEAVWVLLIDGRHHARGRYAFENEKGYLAGMMAGLTKVLTELGQPVDADYYEALHDTCLTGVFQRHGAPMELGFRDSVHLGEGFGVDGDTWSEAGYAELVMKYDGRRKSEDAVGQCLVSHPEKMVGPDVTDKVMRLIPLRRPRARAYAQGLLDRYQSEIGAAHTQSEQLRAIVRCCQDLDQCHLFIDGNIRTIAFLLLTKFLLENGQSPAILFEPNIFDCRSVAEIMAAIENGQKEFAALKKS